MPATTTTLSKSTLDLLKNFASINPSVHVIPNTPMVTVSPMKNIMVQANISETFDTEFAIWDLTKFLGIVSCIENPSFDFEEKSVTISGSRGQTVKYHYADTKLVKDCRPTREFNMPDVKVNFTLLQDALTEVLRASSVLGLADLCIQPNGDKIQLTALSKEDPTSNTYSVDLECPAYDGPDFRFYLKSENLKLLPGDYNVGVAAGVVAEFSHDTRDLTYYIALDSDSSYDG